MDEAEPIELEPGPESYPHLTSAGIEPAHSLQPSIQGPELSLEERIGVSLFQ